MGFGMIVRNSAGDFIAAKALTLPGLFEIKEGEAFGFFFFCFAVVTRTRF